MNNKLISFLKRLLVVGILTFSLLTLLVVAQGQAAPTATFTVNTPDDIDDSACDLAHCSLREAINAANDADGADTIVFTLPPTTTIGIGVSPLPIISDTLTIDGSTAQNLIVSGVPEYSIFRIDSGTMVTITTLSVTGSNTASGGGIFNGGVLTVIGSVIGGNVVYQYDGGGIFNSGLLTIIGSTIEGNYASRYGGGIYNQGGTVNISSSTIAGNWGDGSGGGIATFNGIVNISDSTIAGNRNFMGNGGGIANFGGVLNIDNSTFAGNECFFYHGDCNGGGIYTTSGELYISNSTFFANWAGGLGGVPPFGGGIFGGKAHLSNTIIAVNWGGDCVAVTISTNISNLIGDGSCNPAFSGNPLFGPFQDNGGPTWTVALLPISPAVDNGDEATCAAPPINNLDQRGVTRPLDGDGDGMSFCDIGAFEYDGPPPYKSYLPVVIKN